MIVRPDLADPGRDLGAAAEHERQEHDDRGRSVAQTTAGSTSRRPGERRAQRATRPSWRWRWIASSTTTALSTSMPTASIRPIIDRMLSVRPVKYMSAAGGEQRERDRASPRPAWSITVAQEEEQHAGSRARRRSAPPRAGRRASSDLARAWSVKVSTWMPCSSGSLRSRSSALRARSRHLDRVGARLLDHVEADRARAVEVAAVVEVGLAVATIAATSRERAGPRSSTGRRADLLERGELVDDAQRPASRRRAAAGRRRGCGSRPRAARARRSASRPWRSSASRRELDLHLRRLDAVELDLGDAGHAAQRIGDVAVEQLVVARQVAVGRDAALEHRDVGRAEAVDLDLVDVDRQVVADAVELLARLDAQRPDVLAPVELRRRCSRAGRATTTGCGARGSSSRAPPRPGA